MSRRLGFLPTLLALTAAVLLAGLLVQPGIAADDEIDLPGIAHLAHFRATVFSYDESGSLLWLAGPDGIVRLEIRRAGPNSVGQPMWQPLLEQQGQGWTAILAGHSDDTINAWGAQWRHPPAGLAQAAQLVTTALAAGPPDSQSAPRWRAGQSVGTTKKYRVASLTEDPDSGLMESGWRQQQASLGLGRGGQDDVLTLKWGPLSGDNGATLQVTASRSPGRLELDLLATKSVIYAMPEAFVPLWTLAQLMTFTP